jgi:GDPmannose 4,6-dehydratase
MKTALITGISGQDGSYLAELLLRKNYRIVAITHHDLKEGDKLFGNYKSFYRNIIWEKIDLSETEKIQGFLKKNTPDEVYHLGARSFPSGGFSNNFDAFDDNARGVYNLLDAVFEVNPLARFFFAGTSEMFGDNPKLVMNEEERFYPKTMYGISKLVGHELVRNYRDNMGHFAVTGILFNHESPRRGEEFVTRKITQAAAKIKLGIQKKLVLGSLDSKRDWGDAEDYVEGFYLSLQDEKPSDFVFSSGKLHTVRDFVSIAFSTLDLKYEDYIELDPAFNRPGKYDIVGDSSKAHRVLGWKPKTSFEELVHQMVKSDYDSLKGNS